MQYIKFITVLTILFSKSLLPAQNLLWVKSAHPDNLQVNSIVFGGNGEFLLCGTNCHPAKITRHRISDGAITWDYTVNESLECMMSVALSSDENYFTSAEESGNLMLFDYTQPEPTLSKVIDLGTSYAFSVDFAPLSDKIAVGCSGSRLKVYKIDGTLLWDVSAHPSWVTAVDFSSDGTVIASGGSDNRVKLWSSTGTALKTMSAHTDDITSVRFTPDGSKIISASMDKSVRIWSASSGTLLQSIAASSNPINGLALSPDGQYFAVVTGELVKIWRASDYAQVLEIATDSIGSSTAIAWSPNGNQIAIGTTGGQIALYDLSSVLVSASEAIESAIQLWPNPHKGIVNVQLPQGLEVAEAAIFDLAGRKIYTQVIQEKILTLQLRIPDQGDSPCILHLITAEGISISRVLTTR